MTLQNHRCRERVISQWLAHLAVPVGHSEGHAGWHKQQQRLLLQQFLLKTLYCFPSFSGSLHIHIQTNSTQTLVAVSTHGLCHCWLLLWSHDLVKGSNITQIKWFSPFLMSAVTFSLCISFLICEILIFMASISSSWTWGMGVASESSMVWKVRSDSGMYHLQSYCWLFLEINTHTHTQIIKQQTQVRNTTQT